VNNWLVAYHLIATVKRANGYLSCKYMKHNAGHFSLSQPWAKAQKML